MKEHSLLDVLFVLNRIQNNDWTYFNDRSAWYIFGCEDPSTYNMLVPCS